jgi:hypothetical protein
MCETDYQFEAEGTRCDTYSCIEELKKRKCIGVACAGAEVVLYYNRRVVEESELDYEEETSGQEEISG